MVDKKIKFKGKTYISTSDMGNDCMNCDMNVMADCWRIVKASNNCTKIVFKKVNIKDILLKL